MMLKDVRQSPKKKTVLQLILLVDQKKKKEMLAQMEKKVLKMIQ
jgi:hypothetical protein